MMSILIYNLWFELKLERVCLFKFKFIRAFNLCQMTIIVTMTMTLSPLQTFPQNYAGGGAQTYFGPPALMGPPLAFNIQPGFQEGPWGEACKTSYHWKGPPPKHTVFVVEQQDEGGGGGGSKHSCLSVCSTILCCCCLWNMLTSHLA
ncbi:cysteine-rich and transmembrane domain-containing protein 1-like isoform X1 [Scophthalmus maximus]|uniref:cysteine-rich and transmembrane domain-containing protein 1-like isoform X1 n=1 Tax=Scophthalmus maximus TaxID=52904 RepID=UPI001FA8E42C|nr:cysteine-rich and transmembrane domain-containing protein 1-like isoform X1 [Scophthalmus maximus]